ncbi:cysteine peptidase family C39 domain-containing protein [Zavarzinella formosa]|uniref:hypothetical protein n=1 Tax=Zavarzinella formosa TaxID=360055 RepID=UPI00035CF1CD|nr:hypothetical protein [Zavarzinella formosa]
MPWRIYPDGADPETYQGLDSIYEFVNGDGEFRKFNCGQAAACTFLTHCRVFPGDHTPEEAREIMGLAEKNHPPDNMGGWFGTSRRRVERICRTAGIPIEAVEGEEDLRKHLSDRQPVIVMCGVEGAKLFGRWFAPAGHWMVAYGYDSKNIFLTNWSGPSMTWEEFRKCWGSFIPRMLSIHNIGIAAVTQLVDSPVPGPAPGQPTAIV